MTVIVEMILAWRAGKLTGTQLMRSLVTHPHWIIPISEAAGVEMLATNELPRFQYYRDEKGVNRLMLWSSRETFDLYIKRTGVNQQWHYLDTAGTWVFRLPLRNALDGIDQIWIDPLNEHDILYGKEQFPMLHTMADAVAIEEDVAGLRAGTAKEGAMIRVREYQGYLIAIAHKPSGEKSLMIAPDSQGRKLAAVFTHSDAFDAYLPVAKAHSDGDEIERMQLDGKGLFTILSKMELTGMVFDCSGPVTPVAFAAAMSDLVLNAK
jgi:hypothetical protein